MKKLFLPFLTVISVLFPIAARAQWWGEPLQSIEYNGVIIVHQQVPPRTDVCPWVWYTGRPCYGYQGFDYSRNVHVFWYQPNYNHNGNLNNNSGWNNQWQNPGWNNNGGCIFKKWNRNSGFQIGNC